MDLIIDNAETNSEKEKTKKYYGERLYGILNNYRYLDIEEINYFFEKEEQYIYIFQNFFDEKRRKIICTKLYEKFLNQAFNEISKETSWSYKEAQEEVISKLAISWFIGFVIELKTMKCGTNARKKAEIWIQTKNLYISTYIHLTQC